MRFNAGYKTMGHTKGLADLAPRPSRAVQRYSVRRRFTDDEVRMIRRRRAAGEGPAALAKELGVGAGTIYQIVVGTNYAHVLD